MTRRRQPSPQIHRQRPLRKRGRRSRRMPTPLKAPIAVHQPTPAPQQRKSARRSLTLPPMHHLVRPLRIARPRPTPARPPKRSAQRNQILQPMRLSQRQDRLPAARQALTRSQHRHLRRLLRARQPAPPAPRANPQRRKSRLRPHNSNLRPRTATAWCG